MQISFCPKPVGLFGPYRVLARLLAVLLIGAALLPRCTALAQDLTAVAPVEGAPEQAPQTAIATEIDLRSDENIRERIRSIFSEVQGLRDVGVRVSAGVVTLAGAVPTAEDVERAEAIAGRVAGVVTVQNELKRDLNVDSNLTPALGKFREDIRGLIHGLPLIGVALGIALLIGALGYLLTSFKGFWRRVTPNVFLAELLATLVRFIFVVLGIVAGLEVLGATALLGAVLGGAGVIGIAIGFAIRDTVDNYVSSLMLSLRQPFRANDLVVIEGHEGRVVRLTSRATILMTLDGNHLRIPNSTVFKAIILNYTRNPERQFQFDLGIDAADDPVGGMAVGLEAVRSLPFVLDTPAAAAIIWEVGDSNIVLRFFGWLDQSRTDFLKGRSLALDAAKTALEGAGFALPEPIYRLRFDEVPPAPPQESVGTTKRPGRAPQSVERSKDEPGPDANVAKLVDAERAHTTSDDLLDSRRPIE
ncbi:mechanosensitive ion channel domain-containing protein [Novosphingobium sp. RD2P27]|uniref:Small-conductance mechanosensitive channel n=1 Tax=Novosphingobium kalidii TaxID=3230299 RepID=A0ABV2D408_9SPHN